MEQKQLRRVSGGEAWDGDKGALHVRRANRAHPHRVRLRNVVVELCSTAPTSLLAAYPQTAMRDAMMGGTISCLVLWQKSASTLTLQKTVQ